MTLVKICGLTNLRDALHAWRSGADLLGFVMVPSSPRYVSPEQVAPIISQLWMLGCTSKTVAVIACEDSQEINQIVAACGTNMVQLHTDLPVPTGLALPHLLAHRVRGPIPWVDLLASRPVGLVLDAHSPKGLGGTGESWDYALLQDGERPSAARFLVAGGLSPDNVAQVVRNVQPWGVDVSSGVEAEPGRKDAELLRQFIANVRREDLR